MALLGNFAGRARGALATTLSGPASPPPPPDIAASPPEAGPQPAHPLAYQPVLQTRTTETAQATSPISLQIPVCTSQQIRTAMHDLARAASQDRNGAALQSLVHAFTGVDASSSVGEVVDSGTATDGGRYTAAQPGSFICRGVFTRENVSVRPDPSNASAGITAGALGTLMTPPPNYVENFLVLPLESNTYRLTLLPSAIDYAHPYSTEFTVPASRRAG
jgi:hypothetical protein